MAVSLAWKASPSGSVTGCAPKTYISTHQRLRDNPPPRRRVAYLSSDLREHAIGYLTSEIWQLHDRSKVEIFAYYCGIKSPDRGDSLALTFAYPVQKTDDWVVPTGQHAAWAALDEITGY